MRRIIEVEAADNTCLRCCYYGSGCDNQCKPKHYFTDMSLERAVEIAEECNRWRKGLPPYEETPSSMPFSTAEFGESISVLVYYARNILTTKQ